MRESTQSQLMAVAHGVAPRFGGPGKAPDLMPLGRGLINETFLVTQGDHRWVLQRINGQVFPAPEAIIQNHRTLTGLRDEWGDGGLFELPALLRTREGEDFVRDTEGAVWRAISFIPGALPKPRLSGGDQAYGVGQLLGWFHRLVVRAPDAAFIDTLPGFHETPRYLESFDLALSECPEAGFLDRHPQAPLEFVRARRERALLLDQAQASGRLRPRVIHGDPKLDNVLFRGGHDMPIALIDLDTVKPGLIQHDFGDCVRSCCNVGGEAGVEAVRFDLDLLERLLSGYVCEARAILTEEDLAFFAEAIWLLPFELGLRFLSDHLAGDIYFRVTAPGQNLQRALRQFHLVSLIEAREGAISALVDQARHLLD